VGTYSLRRRSSTVAHTFTFNESSSGGAGAFAVLGVLWWLAVAIFWMYVGWRAMRAHEKLSDATEQIARKGQ